MLSSVKGLEGVEGFGFDELGFLYVFEPLVFIICVLRGSLRFLITYYS